MKRNTAFKVQSNKLDEIAEIYFELREKIKVLNDEISKYKILLESAVIESNETVISAGNYQIRLSESSREIFNLKLARQQLSDKLISKYCSVVNYNRLNVIRKAS